MQLKRTIGVLALNLLSLSAILPIASPAMADGVAVSQATEEQKATAQTLFEGAQTKGNAGDHAGALEGYRASFNVVASPNTELLITRELVALGKLGDAYREAEATERLARSAAAADSKYEQAANSASEEKASIAAKCGFITVDVPGGSGDISVGGRAVSAEERAGPIAVDPGAVDVTLREGSTPIRTKRVNVGAGAKVHVSLAPEKSGGRIAEPKKPSGSSSSMHPFDMGDGQRITGFVVAGVGVVGFAMFAGFGAASQSIFHDLQDQCDAQGRCPASLKEDGDRGKGFQTAANVTVIIGAICLAGGAALIIPTFVVDSGNVARISVDVGLASAGMRLDF